MTEKKILTVVVGMQWGDEGKGKIVDYLSKNADMVVRFNGGNNAGHTVAVKDKVYKFHLLPSGAIYRKKLLIAQGAVINPQILLQEIDELKKAGFPVFLKIDPRVHIVMPYHQALDSASEEWKGKKATGSLKLGIGFCYEDKNNRSGIRFEDLVDKKILLQKLKSVLPLKKSVIEKVYGKKADLPLMGIYKSYADFGRRLKKYLADVALEVCDSMEKKSILFETAHGTFLDPAFGTYPYTVAPQSIAGAVFTGVGFGPTDLNVVGVVKAYATRVGNGPFPTELKDFHGKYLQQKGKEIGTTSGRVRRCGWIDLVMLRTAVKLNNVKELALTKLDVLSGLKEIKVAYFYQNSKAKISFFPSGMNNLDKYKPLYKTYPGWTEDISSIRNFKDLPVNCRKFIKIIRIELGVPVSYISVGPQRDAVIIPENL